MAAKATVAACFSLVTAFHDVGRDASRRIYLTSRRFAPDGLLLELLAVLLTGINALSPVYDAAGELADFVFYYLNPTAQRMAGLAK